VYYITPRTPRQGRDRFPRDEKKRVQLLRPITDLHDFFAPGLLEQGG
jgi:hypothetical protein